MKDFFKLAAPYIFVAMVAFLTGAFVVLAINDSNFTIRGGSGEPFEIIIEDKKITDYDLREIKKNEARALSSKIEELGYDNRLSVELRKLRDRAVGPFRVQDIDILVKFTDNNNFNGNLAQACRGEVLFKELAIFRIAAPGNSSLNIYEMRDFKVLVEKEKCFCAANDIDGKTIWINKEAARNWLKLKKGTLPPEIKAKASVVRTIMYFDNPPMADSLKESRPPDET